MELDGQNAAFNQLDGLPKRQIAFAFAVGFDFQAVVVAQDAGNDIAGVLGDRSR